MKKIIQGVITLNNEKNNDWSFETDDESFSNNIPTAIDEILDRETKSGEKFRITIEKI